MKRLKFRAWDADKKIMITKFTRLIEGGYELLFNDENEMFCGNSMDNGDWNEPILMQYTGLNDINGKEVYEGDLFIENVQGGKKEFRVIEYHNGGFMYSELDSSSGWYFYKGKAERVEVIGNIYEHSHLLNSEPLYKSATPVKVKGDKMSGQ